MGTILDYGKGRPRWSVKKIMVWVGGLLIAGAAGWFGWQKLPVLRAGLEGRAEADRQWRAGHATIYTYGLASHRVDIEPITGLPFEHIAGCLVSKETIAQADWHNDRIDALIAHDGLPTYSWKRREPGICESAKTWKERVERGEVPLAVGNKVIEVKCGSAARVHRLRLPEDTLVLEVDGVPMPIIGYAVNDEVQVLGGTSDDKILYFRGIEKWNITYYGAMEIGESWLQSNIERVTP